ncbi:hypothetical protein [Actinoplanes sp. NPDC049681]|uniref:hypothetical protein n=1 Tax=Actinoplanes sp. NPDC049681 TaxID=3363905 RepID=UPI0037B94C51
MSATSSLVAEDHSFVLADGPEFPLESATWTTGLVAEMAIGAMVYTGVNKGRVQVIADALADAPDHYDLHAWQQLHDWDDIVEITVTAPLGQLGIHQQLLMPGEPAPQLPNMSPAGPGTYRLRAHAAGRDRHYDKNVDDSGERYLFLTWPAPPRPPLIIKSTSWCGYGLRLGEVEKAQ